MRKLLIVGQNLAQASQTKEPFQGTRSGAVLKGWLDQAGLRPDQYEIINAVNEKTPGNKPIPAQLLRLRALSKPFVRKVVTADVVVTLGKQAERAVRLVRRNVPEKLTESLWLTLEHPSGRNRNLNDPKVREFQVRLLRKAAELL